MNSGEIIYVTMHKPVTIVGTLINQARTLRKGSYNITDLYVTEFGFISIEVDNQDIYMLPMSNVSHIKMEKVRDPEDMEVDPNDLLDDLKFKYDNRI